MERRHRPRSPSPHRERGPRSESSLGNKVGALAVLILLAGVPAGLRADAAAEQVAGWWERSVTASVRAREFEPATVDIISEEYTPDGTLVSSERGRTVRQADETMRVLFAEKNGQDTTDSYRKRMESPRGGATAGRPPAGFDATPFNPDWQTALRLGPALRRGDFVEVPYSISSKDVELEGVVMFSGEGKALSASQRWRRRPPFVTELSTTIEYLADGDALFIPGMTVAARIDALVYRRTIRFSMLFSDWRPKPP